MDAMLTSLGRSRFKKEKKDPKDSAYEGFYFVAGMARYLDFYAFSLDLLRRSKEKG